MDRIELAKYFDKNGKRKIITIKDYLDFADKQDKESIAEFIFHRLHSRYLKPFQFSDQKFRSQYKNGFSIMANCCLLIETLQSFKNGWGDSDRKSSQAFKQFFTSEDNFSKFKSKEDEFFKNVRCGILHQGETTGGWTINRGGKNLFDNDKRIVDSVTFAKELEKSLKEYCDTLKSAKWDGEIWDNCRSKMRKIISNCTRDK
jgi:hypothetical protein